MSKRSSASGGTDGAALVRCAIYTRKSSEEGLEQEFNSLDAQREACEAYIRSQKGAGWVALPEMYDDGGISGGTMERPALQRLLADIGAGGIDTVVVYKVDRLTRSLRDFAKIVDAFDAKRVSFVSVTQQFNTTTSMGRLTLNMLLSFAQFEREVTGERIRDKIAASKAKGMWMGGMPPLGYDVVDRKLMVNSTEADTVRHIYGRYSALKSVHALKLELDASGIVSKARHDRHGNPTGSVPIAVGALYHMLQNRLYRGEIAHKGKCYPGQHDAVVDQSLWDEVQMILAENRIERTIRSKAADPSLLTGLVFDASGERMSPTHAVKNGARYRYYVSQSLIKRGRQRPSEAACRVPAADLERIVDDRLRVLLGDEAAMHDAVGTSTVAARKLQIERAADLARRWPSLPHPQKRAALHALVSRIDVRPETVDIAIRTSTLSDVGQSFDVRQIAGVPDDRTLVVSVPALLKRTGQATKLLVQGAAPQRRVDRSLLRLIAQAQRFHTMVMAGQGRSISELATEAGVTRSYFTRIFRLSFLAPEITRGILQGRQPVELSAIKLATAGPLAPDWLHQRRTLGIARNGAT